MLARLGRAYGTRMDKVIGAAKTPEGLGQHFGSGLYEAEISYLVASEFAKSVDDILLRRSKLGLHMSAAEIEALTVWFEQRDAASTAS